MPAHILTAWFMLMFPLVYSPGPANTLFASNGAHFGFRRSIPFMAGIDISFALQSFMAGFGLSALLVRYPIGFEFLRYGGIAYIAYLGLMFLQSAAANIKDQPRCLSFADGFLLTMVNPKAWVMQIMMFSQFLDKGDAWISSVFKFSGLLVLLNISGHIVWILLGSLLFSRAASIFTPRMQNFFFAAMLFGSILFLV